MIGENITVTILGLSCRTIRLGIDAPKDIKVNREEILQALKKAQHGDGYPEPVAVTNTFSQE